MDGAPAPNNITFHNIEEVPVESLNYAHENNIQEPLVILQGFVLELPVDFLKKESVAIKTIEIYIQRPTSGFLSTPSPPMEEGRASVPAGV